MLREIQKTERKQRILDAARRLIRKAGFQGISMRELAKEARVSLVTPYNLFGSKAQVLYALLESISFRIEASLDALDLRDPIEAEYELVRLSVQEYAHDPAFFRNLLIAMVTTGESLPVPRIVKRYTTFWQRGLDAGIAQGYFKPDCRPDLLARHIQLNLRGILELWLEGGIDLQGLETQLHYGVTLCMLAVATAKGRTRLLGRLRDLEQQLDRVTQKWPSEPGEEDKEAAQ